MLGFPRMLLTSILIGQLQKQLSVTLNSPNENSPSLRCSLPSKFFDHLLSFTVFLFIICKKENRVVGLLSAKSDLFDTYFTGFCDSACLIIYVSVLIVLLI